MDTEHDARGAAQLVTAADVDAAERRIADHAAVTPLVRSARLSAATGAEVWLKREDLQVVRSYKLRGAFNLMTQLDPDARAAGVVTASAGNHAQGVAYACNALDVAGRIYLPRTTPRQKRDRIAHLGGSEVEIITLGETYDEAAAAAREDSERTGATPVPAFDDPRTIAGQGTVVSEAVRQLGVAPDYLIVPVGGGGLLAGALTWLGARHPSTRVVGVEPAGAACVRAALTAGEPVDLDAIDSFVDGAAVRRMGRANYDVVAQHDFDLLAVPEGRVCSEMVSFYQSDGMVVEPAGALAAAALGSSELERIGPGSTVVCIVSGGNNDLSRYPEVIERALIHEGRKHYFLVEFPQEPGALRSFLDDVLGPDDDITLFEYVKRSNRETGPALVGIELGNSADLPELLQRMKSAPPNIEKVDPSSALFRFLL